MPIEHINRRGSRLSHIDLNGESAKVSRKTPTEASAAHGERQLKVSQFTGP